MPAAILKVRFEDALKAKLTPKLEDGSHVPKEIMQKYGAMTVDEYNKKKNEDEVFASFRKFKTLN